jgi:hypothetical protein
VTSPGDNYEQAVVEDAARDGLSRWDERVSYHEVAARWLSQRSTTRADQRAGTTDTVITIGQLACRCAGSRLRVIKGIMAS